MIVILLLLVWLGAGILSGAYEYNYFQSRYEIVAERDEKKDYMKHFIGAIPWGVIGLLTDISMDKYMKYGPRFRRYKYVNGVRQP